MTTDGFDAAERQRVTKGAEVTPRPWLRRATTPKVSIGMPVYNGMPTLVAALDSLLAQSFTDFELIISDNASTDDTSKVCREYAARDRRVHYVRQTRNAGAIANFAYVLKASRGQYFMWAASDDLWDPHYIEVLNRTLDSDPECAGAFSPWEGIDRDGKRTVVGPKLGLDDPSPLRRILEVTFGRRDTCTYALWRSRIIKRLSPRTWPGLEHCSDEVSHTWLFQLAAAGTIKECDGTRFYFRVHPSPETPLLTAGRIKLHQIIRTPVAIWKGSGSSLLAAAGAALNLVWQVRNFTWLLTRRTLDLKGETRSECLAQLHQKLIGRLGLRRSKDFAERVEPSPVSENDKCG